MKIQTQKQNDVINIEDINEEYLVVAVIDGNPTILSKGFNEEKTQFGFFKLNTDFTIGNSYKFNNYGTIQKMIEKVLGCPEDKIEAFHQRNWKEALQWLIDNAK